MSEVIACVSLDNTFAVVGIRKTVGAYATLRFDFVEIFQANANEICTLSSHQDNVNTAIVPFSCGVGCVL
jgi:hypothetical protein